MKKTRRSFSKDFKEMIVSLKESGIATKKIAADYDIDRSTVSRWVRESHESERPSFSGNGVPRLTEDEKKIKELQKAYANVKMERDILKKAISIFSQSDGTDTNL